MDLLRAADLRSLIAQQGKWSVSLYMPTQRNGMDQQQNAIRLKNLLAEAETKLLANGVRRSRVQQLMRPAEELLWDDDFWHPQSDGLAIFLSSDFHVTYRLPAQFDELLIIANHFHIKPLLPLLDRAGKFYILVISLGNTRLFQANADAMSEIELDFPTSLRAALWTDEPEQFVDLQSGAANQNEAGEAGFFSERGEADQEQKNIRHFFRRIDEGLNSLIEDKAVPLVLTGRDQLLSMYRDINTYSSVLKDAIMKNPERENLAELRAQAWKVVKPIFEESRKRAFEKYQELSGQQSKLTTNDLMKTVKAARLGQVETLFVPLGEHIWGRYDDEANQAVLVAEPGMEDEDLLDFAASETILNSGQVFAVPPDQVPGDGDLAAILRQEVPGA